MRLLTEYNPTFLNQEFIDWLKENITPELESQDHEEYHYNIQDLISAMEDNAPVLRQFMVQFTSLEELQEDGVDYLAVDLETLKNTGDYVDED